MNSTALPISISTTALTLRLSGLSFMKTDRLEYDGGVDAGRASKRVKTTPPPRPVRVPHSSFRQPQRRRRSARGIVRLDPRDGLASKLAGLCLDLSNSSDALELTFAMESLQIGDELNGAQGTDTVKDIVQEFYRLEALYPVDYLHKIDDASTSTEAFDLAFAFDSLKIGDELSVVQGTESVEDLLDELHCIEALCPIDYFHPVEDACASSVALDLASALESFKVGDDPNVVQGTKGVEDVLEELSRLEALHSIDYFYLVDGAQPVESIPCVEAVTSPVADLPSKKRSREEYEAYTGAALDEAPLKRVKAELEVERAPHPVRVPHSSIIETRRRVLAKSRVRVRRPVPASSPPVTPAPIVSAAVPVCVDTSAVLGDLTNTFDIPGLRACEDTMPVTAIGKKPSGGVKRTRKMPSGRENSPFPLRSQRRGSLARAL